MSANNHDNWEDDPVWNLLDEAPPAKAGPLFARNVLREIRLSGESPAPWWKRILAPVPLTAGAVAAAAFVVLVALDRPEESVAGPPPSSTPAVTEVFDVDQGLLIAAVEEPELFSDEEVLALLY